MNVRWVRVAWDGMLHASGATRSPYTKFRLLCGSESRLFFDSQTGRRTILSRVAVRVPGVLVMQRADRTPGIFGGSRTGRVIGQRP